MKTLVTGAAGFIGSHLCNLLSATGHEVLGVDSFRDYYSPDLKKQRVKSLLSDSGILFKELDLLEYENLEQLIGNFRPDSIFHLAAQPGIRLPIAKSRRYAQDNLVAHTNLIQAAVMNEVPNFLYASSSSVYGNSTRIPFSEDDWDLNPVSLYGSTKLCVEKLTPHYVKNSNTRARGLRFFTVYGPWGRPDMAYFRLIASAIDGRKFALYGDGSIKRDFTFINDITESIIQLDQELQKHEKGFSDLVNIGGGNPHSMTDLIETIEAQLQTRVQLDVQGSNPNDSKVTSASTEYLESLIGKREFTSVEEGIGKVISWSKENHIHKQLRNWINSTI